MGQTGQFEARFERGLTLNSSIGFGARNDIGLAVPFPAYVSDDDDGDDDASWAPKPMLEFRVSPRSNRASN